MSPELKLSLWFGSLVLVGVLCTMLHNYVTTKDNEEQDGV